MFASVNIRDEESFRDADPLLPSHYLSLSVILGLMGAFYWAIRGSAGYGGSQGALLAGLGWATLWYYFSCLGGASRWRMYGSARMIAAITFGVAFGGLTGYGVYNAWVQGNFYENFPEGARAIAPWTGYAMLFLCGLHWGGTAGAFMAWVAPRSPVPWWGWLARIVLGFVGMRLAAALVTALPDLFLPFYAEGIYDVMEYGTVQRAYGSVININSHVGLFLGLLVFEIARRDWRAVGVMCVMALGFALSFSVGAVWQTMHGSELQLDWWKNWEMSVGLGGGLTLGLVFYLFNKPVAAVPQPVTRKERIWGAGFPIWFASGLTLMNAYKGFVVVHNLDWPVSVRVVVSIIIAIPLTAALAWFVHGAYRNPGALPLPLWVCGAVQLILIVAGYVVSVNIPIRPWNTLLLALYTGYIGVSALMVLFMRRCRAACQSS